MENIESFKSTRRQMVFAHLNINSFVAGIKLKNKFASNEISQGNYIIKLRTHSSFQPSQVVWSPKILKYKLFQLSNMKQTSNIQLSDNFLENFYHTNWLECNAAVYLYNT